MRLSGIFVVLLLSAWVPIVHGQCINSIEPSCEVYSKCFEKHSRKGSQKGVRSRNKKNKCILRAMSRPLRLEFPNALYHVTSRGDRREAIFEDNDGRLRFLEILGTVVADYNWLCHGYCLMDQERGLKKGVSRKGSGRE